MYRKFYLFILWICIFPACKFFAQSNTLSLPTLFKLADSLKYSDPSGALNYAQHGLAIAGKTADKKKIAKAHSLVGVIQCIQGDFMESLNNHFEALKINETLNDQAAIAAGYNNIAMVFDNSEKDSAALTYYLKAIAIQEKLAQGKELLKPYNNIGILYSNLGDQDKAISYLTKAANTAHENSLPLVEGSIKHNIALLYILNKNYPKALELLTQSLGVHKRSNNDLGDGF